LYFHHNWRDIEKSAGNTFPAIRDHVLLPWASRIAEADDIMRPRLSERLFTNIVNQIPDAWLLPEPGASTPGALTREDRRRGYVEWLSLRLLAAPAFTEEAMRARAKLL
jgi:hypothetical protein